MARCEPVIEDQLLANYSNAQLADGKYQGNVSFECGSGWLLDGPNFTTCYYPRMWIPQPP